MCIRHRKWMDISMWTTCLIFLLKISIVGALCPILIKYEVSLGQISVLGSDQSSTEVPPFYATISAYSNNDTVNSFKIGWNFTAGEIIRHEQDIFTKNISTIQLSNSTVQLQSFQGNTISPYRWTPISFLAYKNLEDISSLNPYAVAPIADVAFNNLICSKLPLPSAASTNKKVAVEYNNQTSLSPNPLFLEYSPVEFIQTEIEDNGTFSYVIPSTSTTTFLARLSNVKSEEAIELENVMIQYWFNGPENIPDTTDALSQFTFDCLDTTLGCGIIYWNITQGLAETEGAKYVLNIGFVPKSGSLVNDVGDREESNTINVLELLVRINSTQPFLTTMNSSMDYSFKNTSRSDAPITNHTITLPRNYEANTHIPVYLNGKIIWGSEPRAVSDNSSVINVSSNTTQNSSVTCVSTLPTVNAEFEAGTQVCGLLATYCCYGENNAGVTPNIPTGPWPPSSFPIPPQILLSNYEEPSSNNMSAVSSNKDDNGKLTHPSGHKKRAAIAGSISGFFGAMLIGTLIYYWKYQYKHRVKDDPYVGAGILVGRQKHSIDSESNSGSSRTPFASSHANHNRSLRSDSNLEPFGSFVETQGDKIYYNHSSGFRPYTSPAITKFKEYNEDFKDLSSPFSSETITTPWQADSDSLFLENQSAQTMPLLYPKMGGLLDTFDNDLLMEEDETQIQRAKSCDILYNQHQTLGANYSERENSRKKIYQKTSNALPALLRTSSAPTIDLYVNFESEIKPYLGECLGAGGFGSVYKATWKQRQVAVKCLPNLDHTGSTDAQYNALIREVELSSRLKCSRLVSVYGACLKDKASACLIMELVEGGNLYQRIHDARKPKLSLLEILKVTNDIATGLAYMHPDIIHRDLKPQNILLDKNGRAKIADFGISKVKEPTKSFLTATNDNGTPMYMAPEQFNGSRLDEKVDVYALGCILNECLTRRQPWKSMPNFFEIIVQVAIKGTRPPMDPSCPPQVRRLISKCWSQDPRRRPSCAEIKRTTEILIRRELKLLDKR